MGHFYPASVWRALGHRSRLPLYRALTVSLLLHLALLALQFGVPGQGQPSSGWLWGARSVSAPSAAVRVELRAAPVETRALSSTAFPQEMAPARAMAAPPVPAPSGGPKSGFVVRQLAPPAEKTVLPVVSPAIRRPARRHAPRGRPVLSVKKRAGPQDWQIKASTGAAGRDETEPLPRVTNAPSLAEALIVPPAPEPPAAVMPEISAVADVAPPLPAAAQETVPPPPEKSAQILAMETAQQLQRQAAERAEAERVAARALQQREADEARARAQAEAVRRKAERAALAQLADEEAAQASAQQQQAVARAEVLRQQARAEEARQRALVEEQQIEQAREQARREQLAAQQLEAQRRAEAAAEQHRQAKLAAEQAAAALAEQVAMQQAEAARANAAAEAARRNELAAMSQAIPAVGRSPTGSGPASGRSLAEQAMALASSGLPMKPPLQTDSLAQGARRTLPGRNPAEVQLSFYNDSWVQKVERLSRVNYPKLSRHRAYGSLLVSVTIRSDGSLAGVHILKSSGSREVDEAARRLLEMSAPFAAFPPDLRRVYDTIEITRTLSFPDQPPLMISQ